MSEAHSAQHIGSLSELDIVVADDLDMTAIVRGLASPLLHGDESVPQIDERHRVALAAQFACEATPVEREHLGPMGWPRLTARRVRQTAPRRSALRGGPISID